MTTDPTTGLRAGTGMARVERRDERVLTCPGGTRLIQRREWTMYGHVCAPPLVAVPVTPLPPVGPGGVHPLRETEQALVPDGSHGDLWRCDCDRLWWFVETGHRRHWWTRHRFDGTGWIPAGRWLRTRHWRNR